MPRGADIGRPRINGTYIMKKYYAFGTGRCYSNKHYSGASGGRQSRNLSSGATKNRIENRARIDSELGETRRKALLFFQVFKCDRALASLSLVVMKRRMSAISAAMLRLVAVCSRRYWPLIS